MKKINTTTVKTAGIIIGVIAVIAGIILASMFIIGRDKMKDDYHTEKRNPYYAVETIQHYLPDKEIEFKGKNKSITGVRKIISECPEKPDKLYNIWEVKGDINDPMTVIFLIDNDTKVLVAENYGKDFATPNYDKIDVSYLDQRGCVDEAFAYKFRNKAKVILTDQQEFKCSSIWTYNSKTGTVTLIWYDDSAKIWQGIYK